jgi:hypothetical protein
MRQPWQQKFFSPLLKDRSTQVSPQWKQLTRSADAARGGAFSTVPGSPASIEMSNTSLNRIVIIVYP